MFDMNFKRFFSLLIVLFVVLGVSGFAAENGKALVLQEMSWVDVKEYLKTNDMVIIPMGATEQHGPHLPLGTDYYESFGISKLISEKTGVVVAQVLMVGYSIYHSGFPGTLSLKPETMEQVLFETVEVLLKYGFRRFMFLNYHGGNIIPPQALPLPLALATQFKKKMKKRNFSIGMQVKAKLLLCFISDLTWCEWTGRKNLGSRLPHK
jgi:creatinine amidohydrolase/Fe(II)-dependent formamide hydrolase-like protein